MKTILRAVAVCSVLALVAADVGACDRGPIRQLIANRPGILIPRHGSTVTYSACAPAPAASIAYHTPTIVVAGYQSGPVTLPSCADGRCPLPR